MESGPGTPMHLLLPENWKLYYEPASFSPLCKVLRDPATEMMADRGGKSSGSGVKPVPMKLFATWEIEKSAGNCIPRLCSLTLSRLVLNQKLETELNSVIIAVKMQSSKRTLRSNEIALPTVGLLDTELDLSFSLQYPHFLKRDGNKLQVMLQRRKRYKNRTILGYKTLAHGQINMAQVLQGCVDHELSLYSLKDESSPVAHLMMLSVTSQPVDHDENGRRKLRDRSPDLDNYSDEDVEQFDNEDWSNDEMSDLDQMLELDDSRGQRSNKNHHGTARTVIPRQSQRNIKQRFRALLKRFKISEEVLDSEQDQDLVDGDGGQEDIADLLNELEDLSDSGPEMDTLSVLSTPKPSLRPFFTGRCSSTDILEVPKDCGRLSDESSKRNDSDSHPENLTDHEFSDTPPAQASTTGNSPPRKEEVGKLTASDSKQKILNREKSVSLKEKRSKKDRSERRSSYGNIEGLPRKAVLEQLANVLDHDDTLPDCFVLVNTVEQTGQLLAQKLVEAQYKVICTCSKADVKAAVSHLVTKLQKFCNSNNRSPSPIRIGVCGSDGYINSVLRPYVDQFSTRSHDWPNYVTFYVIPYGASSVAKYLGGLDSAYHALFADTWWKDIFDNSDNHKTDMFEVVNRIKRYLSSAGHVFQLPIAEAMVTYKEKSTDEESSQIFIPFLNEVRIGPADLSQSMSVDFDEGASSGASLPSSSPPQSGSLAERLGKEQHPQTPPNSPSISNQLAQVSGSSGPSTPSSAANSPCQPGGEYMDLQLDYWTIIPRPESGEIKDRGTKKESNKASLKTAFKCVQVFRLPLMSDALPTTMCMTVVTKEKKQKIMRIGKKPKESESKSQVIDGINRLICTSKSQTTPLKVTIDGIDWAGVKFFQLSSQWQTHVKHFPVATFTSTDL